MEMEDVSQAYMDFTITANANGPSGPNNLLARGADPLFLLPPGHVLRRAGITLFPTPGALAATLDNVRASDVEAALIPALKPDAGLSAAGFFVFFCWLSWSICSLLSGCCS